MRHVIAFAVVTWSMAASATPVEIDAATKAKQNEKLFASRGWKILPLPPLTAKEQKLYDKYVQQLHAQCPVAYEKGYVRGGVVNAINLVFSYEQGATMDSDQERTVLATGADRDHVIAHCEHLAADELDACRQYLVHNWPYYNSVTQCLKARVGKHPAERYMFQHCATHAAVDPATGHMKLEALACSAVLVKLLEEK